MIRKIGAAALMASVVMTAGCSVKSTNTASSAAADSSSAQTQASGMVETYREETQTVPAGETETGSETASEDQTGSQTETDSQTQTGAQTQTGEQTDADAQASTVDADKDKAAFEAVLDQLSDIHPGTAGSSLAQAKVAAALLDWAQWTAMSADQAREDAKAYGADMDLLGSVADTCSSLKGEEGKELLEDAGVEESGYPWNDKAFEIAQALK